MKKIILFVMLLSISFTVNSQKLSESKKRGEKVYKTNCTTCHRPNGKGMKGAFPPLANSDYLLKDTDRSIKVVLNGLNGKVDVNGSSYYGSMIGYKHLSDQQIADVMNYINNSWGNKMKIVTPEKVATLRKK